MVQDGKLAHVVVPVLNTENNLPVTPKFKCDGHYWMILHDKDLKEDGTPKTPHYHVIFEIKDRHRRSHFMEIAKTFFENITNDVQIQCDVLLNKQKRSNIRYLMHLDDTEKYQYPKDAVKSNDNATLNNCLADAITIDYLLDVVNKSDNLTQVMQVIGLDTYKVYSHAIDIIWKENK